MAKVTFWCDTGANIYSCKEEFFDTVKDLNMAEEEWEGMTDEEKEKEVYQWAQEYFNFGWKEE
jgi:hypothetical protein